MSQDAFLDHLLDLFEAGAEGLASVTRRKMFGCEAFFRMGTIFGLIWKEGRIGLKFPDDATFNEAMALAGSAPWKAGTKVMSRWVLVPESFHDDEAALADWIRRSHAEARETPPAQKTKAPKKKVQAARASKK
jgi:TfoX/Sxy family transcriptional regulator of competence genes